MGGMSFAFLSCDMTWSMEVMPHDDIRRVLNSCSPTWTFKSIPLPENPTYTSDDVTVLIPTICPHNIDLRIQVITASFANKRQQIYEAIPRITTPITILADDDIKLPLESLLHILVLFKDSKISVVSTCQRRIYIKRRNFEILATLYIDGRISCYVTETWLGIPLNADDDNFVTRLLVAKDSLYALLLVTLSHSLITDPLLAFLLYCSTITWDPSYRLLSFFKLVSHFILYSIDICFIPVIILFGYFYGLIKFYALLTLYLVSLRTLPFLILY
ncbi:putative polysaccharide synthase Cps1 [Leptodontidium sp. MPI-SDFR-AT-0119]|nr:putative polysaccharide synthase Cps1 [Leptodontidium sp. MPI-SDFR-AT-0119]